MSSRRFEFVKGNSSKFWVIELEGNSHTVHYGRLGTDGQRKTKEFANADKARATYEKLIAEKQKKGYKKVGSPEATEQAPKEKAAKTTKSEC